MSGNLFTPEKKVEGTIVGIDGNAFSLMGHWQRLAGRQGWSDEDIDLVLEECYSGDYSNLVRTLSAHMDMEGEF